MTDTPSRSLAVILHADVVDSTRLVQENESLAHTRIQSTFRLFSSIIEEYHGVTQELRGDALVASFTRVSDAVSAALSFQHANTQAISQLEDPLAPQVRVGISLGEVVVADRTVTGPGVVLAQRIEQLAEPGGVCISGAVYDTLPQRLACEHVCLGDHQLKGFDDPVRVHSVALREGASPPGVEPIADARTEARRGVSASLGSLAAIVIASMFAVWAFRDGDSSFLSGGSPSFSRPAIAVLPLQNLSPNPEQEYFSDGITDDIINDLSRFSNLTVIARNSVFVYKGTSTPARTIGEELGVDYLLEGSVQRTEDRVRINTQLVDTNSQRQLWAARYDEAIDDLFDLQDRIAREIAQALSVRMSDIEERRVFSQEEPRFPAYDLTLQAQALLRSLTRKENYQARELFRRSISLDESYCPAHAGLGWTHFNAVLYGWTDRPQAELETAEQLARRAIFLDETCVGGHRLLAGVHLQRRQHHLAILELERAIAINPNDADSHAEQGITFVYAGRLEAAIRSLELALKIDPNRSADAHMHLGMALYLQGRYDDALSWLERAAAGNPENVFIHIVLAATYAQLERHADSRRVADAVRRLDPFFSSEHFGTLFRQPESRLHIVDGLRKAGLD